MMNTQQLYELWLKSAVADKDLIPELEAAKGNNDDIYDRFYKELEFGTGGLRGVIGAGTNRMNVYTVGKATQGFANYINKKYTNATVAIGYDSRIKSDVFARTAAGIFAANGIKVYIFPELMPTPVLSFAVRYLKAQAGVVVTASHNPAVYNGYKAYGSDGAQLNLDDSVAVLDEIGKVDMFSGIKSIDFEDGIKSGKIEYIGEELVDAYMAAIKACSITKIADDSFSVIYTPLHGAGNKPVRRILKETGIKNVTVVPEQELPNGNFPTAPYPNPEIRQAFECALKMAETNKADILLATDPDSDRVGIAVLTNGEYKLLTGNQVGVLLFHYILDQKKKNGTLPADPVAVKTIVSTDMCFRIAEDYGCELREVLTGFKFIGEQISGLADIGRTDRFIIGYEESYGYLVGDYARDKDAVVASMLICEMGAFYKAQGKTLVDVLNELYDKYGYYYNSQVSFTCPGADGMKQMEAIMEMLRNTPPKAIAELNVNAVYDYKLSVAKEITSGKTEKIDLPSSNVISFHLDGGASVIVRPSGTEPKIKIYLASVGSSMADSENQATALKDDISKIM
ncbi:MAG: phospho-sugar mutase, partial [Clostridia bacterium]|nr:phospho-sugar mutase [Clostridia bacterium]